MTTTLDGRQPEERHLLDADENEILTEASRRLDPNRNHRCPPLTSLYDVNPVELAAALRRMRE